MVKEQGFEACPADPRVFRKDVWIRPDTANVTEGEFHKSQLQSAQSRLASACSNKPREGWIKSFIRVPVYVGDVVYSSPHVAALVHFEKAQVDRFDAKLPGPWKWLLGLNIAYDRKARRCKVSQETYIEACVKRFGLEDRAAAHTPAAVGQVFDEPKPEERISPKLQRRYMGMIGALMYCQTQTRFDIAATVSVLA